MEQYGFKVTTYNDPVLALSEFKIALFDLLLVDIRMPGMTGLELYEKIKNIDHKIEVCFITAFEVNFQALRVVFPTTIATDDFGCFIWKQTCWSTIIHQDITGSSCNCNKLLT